MHNKWTNTFLIVCYPFCSTVLSLSTALSSIQFVAYMRLQINRRSNSNSNEQIPYLAVAMISLWIFALFTIMTVMRTLTSLTDSISSRESHNINGGKGRVLDGECPWDAKSQKESLKLHPAPLKTLGGLLLHNMLYPCCVLYTLFVPHINWGGVSYFRVRNPVSELRLIKFLTLSFIPYVGKWLDYAHCTW